MADEKTEAEQTPGGGTQTTKTVETKQE